MKTSRLQKTEFLAPVMSGSKLPSRLRLRSAIAPPSSRSAPLSLRLFSQSLLSSNAGTGGDGRRASLTRSGREAEGAPTESGFPFRTVYRPPYQRAQRRERTRTTLRPLRGGGTDSPCPGSGVCHRCCIFFRKIWNRFRCGV